MLARTLANGRVRHVRQRVRAVERVGEGWLLRTAAGETFSVDFLVSADGVRSLVRQKVVGPIPREHLALAVGYRVHSAPDALLFQTYSELEGYLWSFPRTNHASVSIATRLGAVTPLDLWQRVDRFLSETCPEAKKEKRWAGLLPMAQDRSLWEIPCAGPGWAVLGDAAGHVHPLTGEGIAYALWSADLLTVAIGQGNPEGYHSLWQQKYGDELRATPKKLLNKDLGSKAYAIVFQLWIAFALPSAIAS